MGCGFTQCEPIIGNTTIPTQLATGNTISCEKYINVFVKTN